MGLAHLEGSYFDDFNNRIELLEAMFEEKSAHVASVTNSNIEILGISVPTAAWAGSVTSSVNSLRDCLVSRGLMEAAS